MSRKHVKRNNKILHSTLLIVVLIISLTLIILPQTNDKKMENKDNNQNKTIDPKNLETAILAGGCFWCIEASLEQINGIQSVTSGYTGGETENPNYDSVSTGKTGHFEAVLVKYDKTQISYEKVLEKFFELFDPTDDSGSFYDKGSQYKSAIFYKNETEKQIAENVIKKLDESNLYDKPIVTKILSAKEFHIAEEYHQDYYKKSPLRYNSYKKGSGRVQYYEDLAEKKKDLGLE